MALWHIWHWIYMMIYWTHSEDSRTWNGWVFFHLFLKVCIDFKYCNIVGLTFTSIYVWMIYLTLWLCKIDRKKYQNKVAINLILYLVLVVGWVGLWGFLWWAPSAKKDHHGVSSGWSSTWFHSNTGLSSTQYEQIPIILGVWPFWLTLFFGQ